MSREDEICNILRPDHRQPEANAPFDATALMQGFSARVRDLTNSSANSASSAILGDFSLTNSPAAKPDVAAAAIQIGEAARATIRELTGNGRQSISEFSTLLSAKPQDTQSSLAAIAKPEESLLGPTLSASQELARNGQRLSADVIRSWFQQGTTGEAQQALVRNLISSRLSFRPGDLLPPATGKPGELMAPLPKPPTPIDLLPGAKPLDKPGFQPPEGKPESKTDQLLQSKPGDRTTPDIQQLEQLAVNLLQSLFRGGQFDARQLQQVALQCIRLLQNALNHGLADQAPADKPGQKPVEQLPSAKPEGKPADQPLPSAKPEGKPADQPPSAKPEGKPADQPLPSAKPEAKLADQPPPAKPEGKPADQPVPPAEGKPLEQVPAVRPDGKPRGLSPDQLARAREQAIPIEAAPETANQGPAARRPDGKTIESPPPAKPPEKPLPDGVVLAQRGKPKPEEEVQGLPRPPYGQPQNPYLSEQRPLAKPLVQKPSERTPEIQISPLPGTRYGEAPPNPYLPPGKPVEKTRPGIAEKPAAQERPPEKPLVEKPADKPLVQPKPFEKPPEKTIPSHSDDGRMTVDTRAGAARDDRGRETRRADGTSIRTWDYAPDGSMTTREYGPDGRLRLSTSCDQQGQPRTMNAYDNQGRRESTTTWQHNAGSAAFQRYQGDTGRLLYRGNWDGQGQTRIETLDPSGNRLNTASYNRTGELQRVDTRDGRTFTRNGSEWRVTPGATAETQRVSEVRLDSRGDLSYRLADDPGRRLVTETTDGRFLVTGPDGRPRDFVRADNYLHTPMPVESGRRGILGGGEIHNLTGRPLLVVGKGSGFPGEPHGIGYLRVLPAGSPPTDGRRTDFDGIITNPNYQPVVLPNGSILMPARIDDPNVSYVKIPNGTRAVMSRLDTFPLGHAASANPIPASPITGFAHQAFSGTEMAGVVPGPPHVPLSVEPLLGEYRGGQPLYPETAEQRRRDVESLRQRR